MCGFLLIISKTKIDKQKFNNSFEKIYHRGPDNQKKIFLKQKNFNIACGFARLAIQDTASRSNQPFGQNKSNLLFFNGEIFNAEILKNEEKLKTKTTSDTEILYLLIKKYKEKILKKLNGMWAFTFLDIKKNTIFISRDRYGIKPLYYFNDKDELVICSTINGIKTYIQNKALVNFKYFEEYLQHGINYKEKNIFKNIKSFDNSSSYHFNLKTWKFNKKKYFNFNKNLSKEKFNLNQDFLNSTRRWKISDRPVGLMLSGGIDSSLILRSIKDLNIKNIKTYTGYLSKKDLDYIYTKKTMKKINVKNYFIKIKNKNLKFNEFMNICKHQENLFPLMGNVISTYQLYQKISKNNIKVVLDGTGGDEIFCGYEARYFFFIFWNSLINKNYKLLIKLFLNLNIKKIKILLTDFIKKNFYKIKFLNKKQTYLKKTTYELNDPIFKCKININNILKIDAFKGRMQHYLHHLDRNSMAFGIENRSPFMDLELIKYFDTDIEKKFNNSFFKLELRNLFKDFDVAKRVQKSGFSFGRDKFLLNNFTKIRKLINTSKIIRKLFYVDKFLDQLNKISILKKNNLIIVSKLIVIAGIEKEIINQK